MNRIVLLIWGSFIPSIYYGFAEDMEWVTVYWTMVSRVYDTALITCPMLTSG